MSVQPSTLRRSTHVVVFEQVGLRAALRSSVDAIGDFWRRELGGDPWVGYHKGGSMVFARSLPQQVLPSTYATLCCRHETSPPAAIHPPSHCHCTMQSFFRHRTLVPRRPALREVTGCVTPLTAPLSLPPSHCPSFSLLFLTALSHDFSNAWWRWCPVPKPSAGRWPALLGLAQGGMPPSQHLTGCCWMHLR